jgi:flagellar biosynthesis GTPase FlhF
MSELLPIHEISGKTKNLAVAEALRRFGANATLIESKETEDGFSLVVCEEDARRINPGVLVASLKKPIHKIQETRITNNIECISRIMELVKSKKGINKMELTPIQAKGSGVFLGLMKMGFQYEFAKEIEAEVFDVSPVSTLDDALQYINSKLPLMKNDIISQGGWVSFMGPTGVGKTTTLSKIATLVSGVFGKDNIAIVTVDTYRIGAASQLREVADYIGIDFFICETPDELKVLTKTLSQKKLVLLDTAGKSQKDKLLHDQLKMFLSGDIKNLLVMHAGAQYDLLDSTIEAFSENTIHGIIYSKLDEVSKIGEPIQAIYKHQIPVCYLSTGQNVPADILAVKKNTLIEYAVGLSGVRPYQE